MEKRKNGETLIIIPIKSKINEKFELNANYLPNLLICKGKGGNLRWSMIVFYLAEDGKRRDRLKNKTIQNIINNESVEDNGLFKFFDLKGKLLYQLTYKNKKLLAYGSPRINGEKSSLGATVMSGGQCYDWYLETTYFNEDGTIDYKTYQYLFTRCEDGEAGGGGGGGSGDSPEEPEEPVDTEVPANFNYTIDETNYEDEDYQLYETELTPTGGFNELTPYSIPTPLKYNCYVAVTYMAVSRYITSAIASPVTVHPVNETYEHPSWGIVTRNVTVIAPYQNASYAGMTVTAYWGCDLNYRWSYITAGGPPRTRQVPFYYAADMIVP